MSLLHSKPYKILNFEQLFSATNVKTKNCLYKVGEVDWILSILLFFLQWISRSVFLLLKELESIFFAMMSTNTYGKNIVLEWKLAWSDGHGLLKASMSVCVDKNPENETDKQVAKGSKSFNGHLRN